MIPIIVQDATPFQSTNEGVPQVQDNNEVPPPVEQTQQTQEVPLRRSTRERRSAIPDDYIVFLQEHETQIGIREIVRIYLINPIFIWAYILLIQLY